MLSTLPARWTGAEPSQARHREGEENRHRPHVRAQLNDPAATRCPRWSTVLAACSQRGRTPAAFRDARDAFWRVMTGYDHSAHGFSNIPPNIRRIFPVDRLPMAGRQSTPGRDIARTARREGCHCR
eukprot:1185405-Prorocentrum_minimum.AAC.1